MRTVVSPPLAGRCPSLLAGITRFPGCTLLKIVGPLALKCQEYVRNQLPLPVLHQIDTAFHPGWARPVLALTRVRVVC